jgi:hypothetical protein
VPGTTFDLPGTLRSWERRGLVLFLVLVLAFGVLVEVRSAFLQRRMTDLGIYLRGAWAVRTGGDLYQVCDENDWHYNYPPLLAILLTPLADAPPGADRTGLLPFAVSVAIWYGFNVLCLLLGVHTLAVALESTSTNPEVRCQRPGCRRWWALRAWPVLICLPAIGSALSRGQVNLLLLALVCAMTAAALRGRRFQAGLYLAGAICLKVIPAFLLLYPLWRRDVRWLLGCALGLLVGLGVIPALVFGPAAALDSYRAFANVVLHPGLTEGGNSESRAKDLLELKGSDSQSLLAVIHNLSHLDRATRPANALPAVRLAHWIVGGLLTVWTLWAAGWQVRDGPTVVLFLGALCILMVLVSPICHLHYFCLALPLILGLTAAAWEPLRTQGETPPLGKGLALLFASNVVLSTLPRLPVFEVTRDLGLAAWAALLLWLAGVVVLRARTRCGTGLWLGRRFNRSLSRVVGPGGDECAARIGMARRAQI